jgi:hypothetical protein
MYFAVKVYVVKNRPQRVPRQPANVSVPVARNPPACEVCSLTNVSMYQQPSKVPDTTYDAAAPGLARHAPQ